MSQIDPDVDRVEFRQQVTRFLIDEPHWIEAIEEHPTQEERLISSIISQIGYLPFDTTHVITRSVLAELKVIEELFPGFFIKDPEGFTQRFNNACGEQRGTIIGLYNDFVKSEGHSRRQLQNAVYNALGGRDAEGLLIPHWSNLLVKEEE